MTEKKSPSAGAAPVPMARAATVRQTLCELLKQGQMTARDLSVAARIPEKEVFAHLDQLQRSLKGSLRTSPLECHACGKILRQRKHLHPPSKCPFCRESRFSTPTFWLA